MTTQKAEDMPETRWGLPKQLYRSPYTHLLKTLPPTVNRQKASLRLEVYNWLPHHHTVLDLYSGEGHLAALYAPTCKKIICVEKDPAKFTRLQDRMSVFTHATCLQMDNLELLTNLPNHITSGEVTYVDFDAYGVPTAQIKQFFENYPITHALIISLTDGMLLNFRASQSADLLKHYLQDPYLGKGWDRHTTLTMGKKFHQLQKNLLDLLSMRHHAQAHCLYFAVNRKKTVAYSSYLLAPEIKTPTDFQKYMGLKEAKKLDETEISDHYRLINFYSSNTRTT